MHTHTLDLHSNDDKDQPVSVADRFETELERVKTQVAEVDRSPIKRFLPSEEAQMEVVVKPVWGCLAIAIHDPSLLDTAWLEFDWLTSNPNVHVGQHIYSRVQTLFVHGMIKEEVVGPNIVRWLITILNAETSNLGRPEEGVKSTFAAQIVGDRTAAVIKDDRSNGEVHYYCMSRSHLLDGNFSPVAFVQDNRIFNQWLISMLVSATPLRGDNHPLVVVEDLSIETDDPKRWLLDTTTIDTIRIRDLRRSLIHTFVRRLTGETGFDLVRWIRQTYDTIFLELVRGPGSTDYSESDEKHDDLVDENRCPAACLHTMSCLHVDPFYPTSVAVEAIDPNYIAEGEGIQVISLPVKREEEQEQETSTDYEAGSVEEMEPQPAQRIRTGADDEYDGSETEDCAIMTESADGLVDNHAHDDRDDNRGNR